jgi:hypothetical protein
MPPAEGSEPKTQLEIPILKVTIKVTVEKGLMGNAGALDGSMFVLEKGGIRYTSSEIK